MIPLYIIEEHHEAFFIWNYALIQNIITNSRHTLLHVDEHSDMNIPMLHQSVKTARSNITTLLNFTRNQLSLSEFIVPSIYLGLFNTIFWMRRSHSKKNPEYFLNVVSENSKGVHLFMTDNFLKAGMFNPDRKSCIYQQISHETKVLFSSPVILDIDLDYFCCDPYRGESIEVEITEQEYNQFKTNPYHRLKIICGGKLKAKKDSNRYYYIYQPFITNARKTEDPKIFSSRIDQFATFLKENRIEPILIDICRSRYSGFTTQDYWQQIESQLLEKLNQLYPLTIHHFNEIAG